MVDNEDLHQQLTTMANLADELDKVMSTKITNEDFMMTMFFSIMGIPQYTNVVEIVMNGPMLGIEDLIKKLTTMEQHKVTNERPPEFYTAMQALIKEKERKRKVRVLIAARKDSLQRSVVPNDKRTPQREGKQDNQRENGVCFYDPIGREPIQRIQHVDLEHWCIPPHGVIQDIVNQGKTV